MTLKADSPNAKENTTTRIDKEIHIFQDADYGEYSYSLN